MSMSKQDENNFFFDKNCENKISKEKIISEEKNQRTSVSTNETFEFEFCSDDEIDFNFDFFPKKTTLKFTDMLVDNWKEKIKIVRDDIIKNLINEKNIIEQNSE